MNDDNRFFDELQGNGTAPRAPYQDYANWFHGEDLKDLRRKSDEAETFFRRTGITFNPVI